MNEQLTYILLIFRKIIFFTHHNLSITHINYWFLKKLTFINTLNTNEL